jgi:hypothetical protein
MLAPTMGVSFLGLFILLGGLIGVVLLPVCFWRICEKAGFSPWLGLGILLPVVNLALLFFLAFSEWPAHRERDAILSRND